MERVNEALQQARKASKLHKILDDFFTAQTAITIEAIKSCPRTDLLGKQAYLIAIDKLEQALLEHVNKYNLIEVRRQHAGTD